MNGQPYRAARFAATLRRQLFRKHLGLLKPQDMERPDRNFEPIGVPNVYDFGSREDQAVMDPLSDTFLDLWNGRARTNSYAFGRIFHPVPHDDIRTWKDYDAFYETFFKAADEEAEGKKSNQKPAKYQWGHVVEEKFSPGDRGVREVKDLLHTIRGTLVDMPLNFLIKEDIAIEGISLNAFTEEVYT
jgi:phospholipase D1/2